VDAAGAEGGVKVVLTILGEPASKANQRQLVSFPDGKGGKRPALIKSKKARNYEGDALKQIPPRCRVQLSGPVRVTMHVYYASERPDLDESVILDVLQDRYARNELSQRVIVQKGVYCNDRQVREKHVYHHIDRANPRAEIEVEALVAQQAQLVAA
jgi:Holliday junction resolvase RusA-like endonuclease